MQVQGESINSKESFSLKHINSKNQYVQKNQNMNIDQLIKCLLKQQQQQQSLQQHKFVKFRSASQYPYQYINKYSQMFLQYSKNNQTQLIIKQINKLKCLYNDKSYAQFMCSNITCDKNPFICKQLCQQSQSQIQMSSQKSQIKQCQCKKDHYSCKFIKSSVIINQLFQKINKPIRKQFINYWLVKRQLYKWMLNSRISQQRQIIYKKYQDIKETVLNIKNRFKSKEDKKNQLTNLKLNYNLYIYNQQFKKKQKNKFFQNIDQIFEQKPLDFCQETNLKYNYQQCYQKKLLQQKDKYKYHLDCNCKSQIINLNLYIDMDNIQQSCSNLLQTLKNTLSQYSKFIKQFQNIQQKLQCQLIMINMNPFEREIYLSLTSLNQELNKSSIKNNDMDFNGHLIFRAKQYKNSYYHEKKFVQQTNLNNLKDKWEKKIHPYFNRVIQGNICKKLTQLIKKTKKQQFQQQQQISIEIILKRLNFLQNDFMANQKSLVPNYLLENQRRKQRKNQKVMKIAHQFMNQLTTKNEFQISYSEGYCQNIKFLRQTNSYQTIFKNYELSESKQNDKIYEELKTNKFQICYDLEDQIIQEKNCSFLTEKMKHYYPPYLYFEDDPLQIQEKEWKLRKFYFILQNFEKAYNISILQPIEDFMICQSTIQKFTKFINKLKVLDLKYIQKIYFNVLSKYSYSFKNIKKLIISRDEPKKNQIAYQSLSQNMKVQLYNKISQMNIQAVNFNDQNIDNQLFQIIHKQNNIQSFSIEKNLNNYQILNPSYLNLKNLKALYMYDSIQALFDSNICFEMKNLSNLYIYTYKDLYKEPSLEKISQLSGLKVLVLNFYKKEKYISNKIIPSILKLKNLSSITISYSKITSKEIRKLTSLENIESLTFNKIRAKTSDLLYLVHYLKKLEYLEIPLIVLKQQINQQDLIEKDQKQMIFLNNQIIERKDKQNQNYEKINFQELIQINDNIKSFELYIQNLTENHYIFERKKKKVSKDEIGQLKYFNILPRLQTIYFGHETFSRAQWIFDPNKSVTRLNQQKNQQIDI